MTPVEVFPGDRPVVLGQPHGGTWLPDDVADRLNDTGRALADTDWHIGQLYDGLLLGATVVRATFHRYLIDANRDPSGASLYPGQNTTGLVPLTDFDGRPIWETPPDAAEIADRRDRFHAPYHAALAQELARVKARHGHAILWDCHSIRSVIPFLFEGTLPDLNIGTNGGTTCASALERMVATACGLDAAEGGSQPARLSDVPAVGAARSADANRPGVSPTTYPAYTATLNGRFKGGWTTRHYGRPAEGIHAIQMEIAQSAYLNAEAPPWTFDAARAARLRTHLARILADLEQWIPRDG